MSSSLENEGEKSYDDVLPKKREDDERPADEKIFRMMVKMSYKSGTELEKNVQGIIAPANMRVQFDKTVLDLCLEDRRSKGVGWDPSLEKISVKEELLWLSNEESSVLSPDEALTWMIKGEPPRDAGGELEFIDADLLGNISRAKQVFDEVGLATLSRARSRANPFETVGRAFFMNRAALKMANIDAIAGFAFTNLDRDPHHRNPDGPYYFADVCSGPGGFSEYVLWRKKWLYKGFGLTLKGEHDFQLHDSTCMSPVTFQPYYGGNQDGDVYNPANASDFAEKVLQQTDGLGVHFMMSDGGFSVEGREHLQEVLSKHLYLCQCLLALEIIRERGYFVTKLFDVFTRFSVGLVFLMYRCFEKIAIVKPNSSRPANSERYLICSGLKAARHTSQIRGYLRQVALELWNVKRSGLEDVDDVVEIVPLSVLKGDVRFFEYVKDSNASLGERQRVGLLKLAVFARNPQLDEPRQETLRAQCLAHWGIPDAPRPAPAKLTVDDLLSSAVSQPDFMFARPAEVDSVDALAQAASDFKEWHFVTAGGRDTCGFFVGLGGKNVAYKLQKSSRWVRVRNVRLCRGTILYGEVVRERCVLKPDGEEREVRSLHVVDALRLGDTSLADLPFHERLACVNTYCKAANFEGVPNIARIRPKTISPLESMSDAQSSIVYDPDAKLYYTGLAVIGLNTSREYHTVDSIILLKTDEKQSFSSTYAQRIEAHLNEEACGVSLARLRDLLRPKL